MNTLTTNRMATAPQENLIDRLLEERDLGDTNRASVAAARERGLTAREASGMIDWLFQVPRKAQEPTQHVDGAAVTEGYYLQEDTVYKVVKAKSTGNLYAKALHTSDYGRASWDYAPGAMRHLRGAARLTLEQAAEMGTRCGVCVVCGATLTDPESVERGIGPVCAARL